MKKGKQGRLFANWRSRHGVLRDLDTSIAASAKLYRSPDVHATEQELTDDWGQAELMVVSAPLDDGGKLEVEIEFDGGRRREVGEGGKAERGFHHFAEAWYFESHRKASREGAPVDDVTFGLYSATDGSTVGELTMEWVPLGEFRVPTPCLRVWDAAFDLLPQFTDVWKELVGRRNMRPATFCEVLKHCGFKDLTERKGPKG